MPRDYGVFSIPYLRGSADATGEARSLFASPPPPRLHSGPVFFLVKISVKIAHNYRCGDHFESACWGTSSLSHSETEKCARGEAKCPTPVPKVMIPGSPKMGTLSRWHHEIMRGLSQLLQVLPPSPPTQRVEPTHPLVSPRGEDSLLKR